MAAEEGLYPMLLTMNLGLDLSTPKPAAQPGSLIDCLNYERTTVDGMSRIDGYEPYDARTEADVTSYRVINTSYPHGLVVGDDVATQEELLGNVVLLESLLEHLSDQFIGTRTAGAAVVDLLRVEAPIYSLAPDPDGYRNVFLGTVVEVISSTSFVIACVNEELLRNAITLVKINLGGTHVVSGLVTSFKDINVDIYDPTANFTKRRAYATILRNRIGALPGACGLHWLNGVLYAVAPSQAVTEGSAGVLYRARDMQVLLDDDSGTALVKGWEEIDLGNTTAVIEGVTQTIKNSVPLAPTLERYSSKYQFITANFYGSEITTAMYGVSGAGRAFVFDAAGFRNIDTGLTADLDKPRHIAKFADRLALGYSNGSVLFSVVGNPENFSGVAGAVEIAFGDKIVGLQVLAGKALGVFCENGVYYVDADLNVSTITPNLGCIEYTVAAIGVPIYCSPAGIMTLEQTSAYGDFVGVPLSEKVDSWLRPRLRRVQGKYSSYPSVIGNMVVRTKNQYRLYFRDGDILTMTITPSGPVFTKQRYTFVKDDVTHTFVPYATCSQMGEDGTEKLFTVHRNPASNIAYDYVVSIDSGWGFAGVPLPYYVETNTFNGQNPFTYYRVTKARVHGLARGLSSSKLQTSGTADGYTDDYNESQVQYIDLPNTKRLYTDGYVPTTDIVDLADRGLRLKLKFSNRDLTETEPSHVCQLVTLLLKSGGKLDV